MSLFDDVVKVGTLGLIDDVTGSQGAADAARAGTSQALGAREDASTELRDFAGQQRDTMAGRVGGYTNEMLGNQQQYGQEMRMAAQQRQAAQQGQLQGGLSAMNQRMDPYSQMGAKSLADMQNLAGQGLDVDVTQDPGYKFRMQEGLKAQQRQQSASGMGMSGRGLKEMAKYSQGLASQEYGSAWDRANTQREQQLGAMGRAGSIGAGMAGMQGQMGMQGSRDMAGAVADLSGSIQNPNAILGSSLQQLNSIDAGYGNIMTGDIGNMGQARADAAQSRGQIGAGEAVAGWNTAMGLGNLAVSAYGAGAGGGFGGGGGYYDTSGG